MTCHGVATFKEICICRNEDCSLIDIGTVFRVISSFTYAEKFWFIESVWKPDLLFEFRRKKPLESSETFDRTIAEVKQTRMFSIMADEAADVFNLLLSSAMSTLQRIFERSLVVSAIVEKKQLLTQWIKE